MSEPATTAPRPMDKCKSAPTSREMDALEDVGFEVLAGHSMLVLNRFVIPEKSTGVVFSEKVLLNAPKSLGSAKVKYTDEQKEDQRISPCQRSRGSEPLRTIQSIGKNVVPVDFISCAGMRPRPPVTALSWRPYILIALRAQALDGEVDSITPVTDKMACEINRS